MKIKQNVTERGFRLVEFTDRYNNSCSIQKSSLATEDAIWFGIDDPNPQIMSSDALKLGLNVGSKNTGWVKYDIPEEVMLSTRMHLTRKQVKKLLPILKHFSKTGEILNEQEEA